MEAILTKKVLSPSKIVSYIEFKINEPFKMKEGQFAMIEKELHGNIVKRAYSIATTQKKYDEEQTIGFIVKKASENGMSNFLTQDINIGDSVKLTGAYGHMTDDKTIKNYLLISVGSGLGPIFSIFNHLVYESKDYGKIAHLFGERFFDNTIDEINQKLNINNENIISNFFLSKEIELPKGYKRGYVQDGIDESLSFLGNNDIKVFICGLPAMVDEVTEKLLSRGIPKENIKSEKY